MYPFFKMRYYGKSTKYEENHFKKHEFCQKIFFISFIFTKYVFFNKWYFSILWWYDFFKLIAWVSNIILENDFVIQIINFGKYTEAESLYVTVQGSLKNYEM